MSICKWSLFRYTTPLQCFQIKALLYCGKENLRVNEKMRVKRIAHRGARTPDHQVKSLALYRLS